MKIDVTTHGSTPRLVIDGGPLAGSRIKDEIPGSRFDRPTMTWHVPMSWQAALEIGDLAKSMGATIVPSADAQTWLNDVTTQVGMLTDLSRFDAQVDHMVLPGLFGHQRSGAAWLAVDTPDFPGRLLLDEMGCLAGDSLLTVNRGGKSSRMRIDHVVRMFNGGRHPRNGTRWRQDIPTMVARAEGGVSRLVRVVGAWESGVKTTYTVTTDSGRTIRATDEHPFLTTQGWSRLDELVPGTQVLVNIGRSTKGRTAPKRYYAQTFGMDNHPYRSWWASKYWAVPTHRLVAEAVRNGVSLEVLVDKVREGDITGLEFIDPAEYAVHHVNHDHLNNDPSNLEVLTHREHHQRHAAEGKTNHVLDQIGIEVVESVVPFGEEMTYDIEVADDPHCFLANGFVVHNTGKTRTVIEALSQIEQWPVLVVCPSTVKQAWAKEFDLVRPDLRVVVVDGTATRRRKQLATEADVYVINYESARIHSRLSAYPSVALTDKQKQPGELNRDWAVVIADEAHKLKNPKALQTMALWGIGATAMRRWALTGTPVANSPDDLWSVLRFVDPEAWPVKSKWVNRYCNTEIDWFGVFRITGMKPEQRTVWEQGWKPVNRRVLKAAVLDLPPVLRQTREVPMAKVQRQAYEQMAESMVARVENGLLTVENALVQSGRLTVMASAYGKIGGTVDEPTYELAAPSNKAEQFIKDYLDGDFPGSTVVGMSSKKLLTLLRAALDKAGLSSEYTWIDGDVNQDMRTARMNDFQDGKVPLFLMTYATGGTGITLTKASRMVCLQRDWSRVLMKQAVDRVHRIGSEVHDNVTVIDYVTPGTIEVGQLDRLEEKEATAQEVVRDAAALRRLLNGE